MSFEPVFYPLANGPIEPIDRWTHSGCGCRNYGYHAALRLLGSVAIDTKRCFNSGIHGIHIGENKSCRERRERREKREKEREREREREREEREREGREREEREREEREKEKRGREKRVKIETEEREKDR